MKEKMKRVWILLSAALLSLSDAVPAFADEIYEPPNYEKSYNIVSYFLLFAYIIVGLMIVTGIVLLIVFSVRRRKRKKAAQQADQKKGNE